jgi:putative DNA primase/helicase
MPAAKSTHSAVPASTALVLGNGRKLVRYSEITKQPIQWLWPQRIALGKLTLLVGEPGLGKGLLAVDLAARVSRGLAWPDQPQDHAPLGTAIILHAEDDQYDTMPERLEAAGADLSKVITIDSAAAGDGASPARPLSLRHELDALQAALAQASDCKLVVIDPITAYLGGADGNQNGEIRELMYALGELARRYRVAMVAVAHLNKRSTANTTNGVLGALSFVSTARCVWRIMRDPVDPQRRLMLSVKNNVADENGGASFQLTKVDGKLAPRLQWNPQQITASVLSQATLPRFNLGEQKYRDGETFAMQRLREILSDGPMIKMLVSLNSPLSEDQLYRAADRLGVVKVKDGFVGGWVWMLPEDVERWEQSRDDRKLTEQKKQLQHKTHKQKTQVARQAEDEPSKAQLRAMAKMGMTIPEIQQEAARLIDEEIAELERKLRS